jgi:hypothetical protein
MAQRAEEHAGFDALDMKYMKQRAWLQATHPFLVGALGPQRLGKVSQAPGPWRSRLCERPESW